MSKNKIRNIEEVTAKIELNDNLHYLIKFEGEKNHRLIEENKLTKLEKKICENILLNRKRKNSDDIGMKNSKSPKKYQKRNNKREDNESYNNSSSSSFSNIKVKQKKIKTQNKENNNIYSNKNLSSGNDSDSISENKSKSENIIESESQSKKEKTKKYERQGVLLEDTPKEILNVGYKNKNDKTLYSLVRWKQSKNIQILDSIVENKKIRQIYPQLLIDFYESKIIFLED